MRKLLIFIFIMQTFLTIAFSQNIVISKLKQPPPNKFGLADLWEFELINTTRNELNCYITGTLSEEKEGLIVFAKSKIIKLKPGRQTFSQKDFVNPEINYYNEKFKQALIRTSQAPEGDYIICLTVYNEADEVIGFENCIYHSIRKYSQIILISPENDDIINLNIGSSSPSDRAIKGGSETSSISPSNNLQNQLIFQWNQPVSDPNLLSEITYDFRIVEIIGKQTPFIAIRDNKPFYQTEIKSNNFFIYPIYARRFESGKKYAWQVYAKNNPEQTASEIWVFTISGVKDDLANQDTSSTDQGSNLKKAPVSTPCGGNLPNINITNNTPDNKNASAYEGNYVKVGYFKMKVLQATGSSSGLTGKGSILVPWLKTPIAVEFNNIKINSDTVMFQGSVITEKDETPENWPYQWMLNAVGNFNWTANKIKNLINWLHNKVSGWPVVNKLVKDFDLNQMIQNYTNNPLKLPLGFNNIKGYTIAISEMKFEPTVAKLNCLAIFPVEDDTLAFAGNEIIFDPIGPKGYQGELALIEDVNILENVPNGDSYEIIIKKKQGRAVVGLPKGTYINWDCDGFNSINLEVDILFPRSWLIPVPDNGQKAKANFSATVEHWDDLMIKTSLNRCKIVGTAGIEIEIKELWFDNTIAANPVSIVFPSNYVGSQGPDFTGFFIKQADIFLPDKFQSNSNQTIIIQANNMIINKHGLTGDIAAANLLALNNGKIGSMAASVDSLKLKLLNSSITQAYLRGKIVLPISEDASQNALGYKIHLTNSTALQAEVFPLSNIKAKLFGDATLTINSNSSFKLWLAQNEKFLITLNGNLNFGNVDILNVKKVDIKTSFQNLKIDYDDSRTANQDKFIFDQGQWSFASPQKFISRIPVTIKDVKIEKRNTVGSELYRGALKFKVEINLSEKFSGSSSLSIVGAITKNSNWKFKPDLVKAEVDTIKLKTNLPAVKLNGSIAFFNEDANPIYGNGFSGTIKAVFNSIQMEVNSNFRTGSTKHNNGEQYYRYWYVEAKAILPKQSAIQFLPGAAFYGFGAAAWQRINVSNLNTPSVSEINNASSVSNTPSTGAQFTPNKNIGFGFKVMTVMGTYPEPKTFNLDAALTGQFSTSGGLNKISFAVDFWSQAELLKRNESPLYGNAVIEYTPPDKLFVLSAQAAVKYPSSNPIVSSFEVGNPNDKISLTLLINGKNNKWYFTAGTPYQTNKIKILSVTSWEYLMFGNDIKQFERTGFQPQTINGLNSVGLYPTSPTTNIPSLAGTGRGFSFGAGVFFSVDKSLDLDWLSWAVGGRVPKLKYGGSGGFEINLSLLQYNGCNGNTIGFNNWYANGSLAAWLYGYARVHLSKKNPTCLVCCKKKKDPPGECVADLASLKVGFWTQGGFPRPSWIQGSASVYVNVFGLTWSGNVDINWGTPCSNIQQVSYSQTFQQEVASEKVGELILKVEPEIYDIIPPSKKIQVFVAYDEMPFEVPELQSNGIVSMKTFKLQYSYELYKSEKITTTIGNNTISLIQINPKTIFRSSQLNSMNAYEFWSIQQNVPNNGIIYFDPESKYIFKVKAELYQYNSTSNSFVKAKDKNGNDIFEIENIIFETDKIKPNNTMPSNATQ